MDTGFWVVLLLALAVLVVVSLVVEGLRKKPVPPVSLVWDPSIRIHYVDLRGVATRYIKTGSGPNLVLLHTLRTQLDIFQKIIPPLAREFTVYAMDLPGHGWSGIPRADYTPELFRRYVSDFFETLDIKDALVVGVSIGASIPLLMSAQGSSRLRGIVSINPYDYGKRGIERANLVAKILFTLAAIPGIGETVMRLRNRVVEGKVLEGGVATPSALPPEFREEVFRVGERPGHYQAFINLIRHMPLWRPTHAAYGRVRVPVLLVYGDHDWSREPERQATLREIPGARLAMVKNGGHFLPLDQPEAVIQQIRSFARELGKRNGGTGVRR